MSNFTGLDFTTIRDAYYKYRKAYPDRYQTIQNLTKSQYRQREDIGDRASLALELAWMEQLKIAHSE